MVCVDDCHEHMALDTRDICSPRLRRSNRIFIRLSIVRTTIQACSDTFMRWRILDSVSMILA